MDCNWLWWKTPNRPSQLFTSYHSFSQPITA